MPTLESVAGDIIGSRLYQLSGKAAAWSRFGELRKADMGSHLHGAVRLRCFQQAANPCIGLSCSRYSCKTCGIGKALYPNLDKVDIVLG